jgi:hypothetical protein
MRRFCVLDMSSLRFHRDRGRIAVLAGSGEMLVSCADDESLDDREAALCGMDTLLATGKLRRHDADGSHVEAVVALYNPYTMEVAVGAMPDTVVYGDGSPLELPGAGALAGSDGGELVLGARTLAVREPEWASVLRAQAAHLG